MLSGMWKASAGAVYQNEFGGGVMAKCEGCGEVRVVESRVVSSENKSSFSVGL